MAKKLIEIKVNESEKPISKSEKKAALEATIELLKKQNPEKYKLNESALKAKLAGL